jgi:hypothetical protein
MSRKLPKGRPGRAAFLSCLQLAAQRPGHYHRPRPNANHAVPRLALQHPLRSLHQKGTPVAPPNCACDHEENEAAGGVVDDERQPHSGPFTKQEWDMHQIIYLVGLIVVILAILSFFGLR